MLQARSRLHMATLASHACLKVLPIHNLHTFVGEPSLPASSTTSYVPKSAISLSTATSSSFHGQTGLYSSYKPTVRYQSL